MNVAAAPVIAAALLAIVILLLRIYLPILSTSQSILD